MRVIAGRRRRVVAGPTAVALAALMAASGAASATGAPSGSEDLSCEGIRVDTPIARTRTQSAPLAVLGVEQAHERRRARGAPGSGVTVAVIDSGVVPGNGLIDLAGSEVLAGGGPPVSGHGTTVAGLIAGRPRPDGDGPVGVAPGARVLSLRVLDSRQPRDGEVGVRSDNVAAGLAWVADNAAAVDLVNVSLAVPDSPALRRAVERVQAAGVLIVAATGDRPLDASDPLYAAFPGDFSPSEDASETVFPAGYPGVLAVNAIPLEGEEPYAGVLRNSRTDVAAPTFGGVSYGMNGSSCVVDRTSSEYATAVVSGVAALLRAEFPRDTPEQTIARLRATADGSDAVRTPLAGAGMVQPLEALTRDLRPEADGALSRSAPADRGDASAVPPPPREDLFADSRSRFVWWGLVAGGLLVLAMLVRPLVRRA